MSRPSGGGARPTRPVLRYHGGKWRLAPWIIGFFPPHRVFVEPYGGAASVLLRKPRAYAEVYNDLDGEIVNLFMVLREHGAELAAALRLTPFARDEFDLAYQASDDPIEQARRTLFRSFAGFGTGGASGHRTGFRNNATRSGTTPAGDWGGFAEHIAALTARLRGVVIEHRPAADVMRNFDGPETLHYVDPPYPLGTRTLKGHYSGVYRHEMKDDDHRQLAVVLNELQGMVVLSGYASNLYDRELFPSWERHEQDTHADGALDRVEVLWLNPAAASRRDAQPTLDIA